MSILATCHCGAVSIEVPAAPQTVTDCNCSLCRRLGTLWAYYDPARTTVTGETATYQWGARTLTVHRCARCGTTTHWSPVGADAHRMGVNARLMPPEILAAARRRRVDGAADTWAELP